jgi:hypothetical protein
MTEPQAFDPPERRVPRVSSTFVVAGALLVALVVVTASITLIRSAQPTAVAPGSPEATLQAYLVASDAHDWEAAYAMFSADVRRATPLSQYRRMASDVAQWDTADRRVVLDRVEPNGDVALLHLRVETFSQGALSADRYSSPREIRLVKESGAWQIDELLVGTDAMEGAYQ